MSFVERRNVHRPASGEAPFDLSEAFYSRTDTRGVIRAGNFVFQRVSNFEWDELIGAPHKIVRHPDMPKGVFWLLRDTIRQGKPMGAYVKNRTKDGLHYWVFALVVPCQDGYLSARIKPSSSIFRSIIEEYGNLRARESKEQLTPEESARLLLERIGELGFEDYDQFASWALGEELLSRDENLARQPSAKIVRYRQALEIARSLEETTQELIADFASIRYAPINMGVIASRIEPTGGPINSLSKNYGLMSREISNWFDTTVIGPESNFASIKTSIRSCLFVEGMSQVLRQCSAQLLSERRQLGQVNMEEERDFLDALTDDYVALSEDRLSRVRDDADRIAIACKKMHKMMQGLSTTRVLCRVESARLSVGSESLNNIIEELKLHQDRISARLEKIVGFSGAIHDFVTKTGSKSSVRQGS